MVTVTGPSGTAEEVGYDRLVKATGAVPVRPPLAGVNGLGPADGVHVLHTVGDTFSLLNTLERSARSVVIIGAGYIGLEMAETLTTRGLKVTVVERCRRCCPPWTRTWPPWCRPNSSATGARVHRYRGDLGGPQPAGADCPGARDRQPAATYWERADVVLVVVVVRPDTMLVASAGLELEVRGAIAVDRQMRTNVPDVFAAGDCVQTYHRVLDTDTYLPLGTTAHKQGRVAGANALGVPQVFAGSVGTQVVKVFDLVAARTGLRDADLANSGLDGVSRRVEADDHKVYYPGAQPITIKVTGDPHSGRLLGAQMVGHCDTGVHTRVDVYAAALHHGMRVEEVSELDRRSGDRQPQPVVVWAVMRCDPRCRRGYWRPRRCTR